MSRISIAIVTYMAVSMSAIGQDGTRVSNKKYRLTSINQFGLLTGQRGEAGLFQTINGLTIDKWFVGVGASFDYYGLRSIPVFIDIRRELAAKKNRPFVYFDGGVSFPYATDAQKESKGYPVHSSNGLFADGGLGFKLKLKGDHALLLSAGYSYKKVVDRIELYSIAIWPGPGALYEYYNYEYRRIVFKIGLEL